MNGLVAKDDKDGQLKILREALEKIQKIAYRGCREWSGEPKDMEVLEKIEHTARIALFDTTF